MQQLFSLLIFLNQPYMFRTTNSPILKSTFWIYLQVLVHCTDTAADRCHGCGTGRQKCRCIVPKAVHTVKKCSWGWANMSPETCKADLKRLINEIIVASCWFLHRCTNYARSVWPCIISTHEWHYVPFFIVTYQYFTTWNSLESWDFMQLWKKMIVQNADAVKCSAVIFLSFWRSRIIRN